MARVFTCAFALAAMLMALGTAAHAQHTVPSRTTSADVSVRVIYDNEHPVGRQIRVELENSSGIRVGQTFTDEDGRVEFHVTEEGSYEVKVEGSSIQPASEAFQIQDMDKSRTVYVHVKPSGSQVESAKAPTAPVTSAAVLRAPNDARKAFKKGMEAWQSNQFEKAAQYFEKAVAIYPEYDTAYNNLGVMYAHLAQFDKALVAFQRSVQLNDKNAEADRNLARLMLQENRLPQAAELLKKSLAVEPLNSISLTMLAAAELGSGQLEAALEDARKAHGVPHDGYALCHYLAGQALERERKYQDASAEYQTYLKEAPNGPEGPEVRSALQRLGTAAPSQANAQ